MVKYQTIRTVTSEREAIEDVGKKAKYGVGDYMEVYAGRNEGHNFTIAAVRYNHDYGKFQYLYDHPLLGDWHFENMVTLVAKATPKP